MKKNKSFILSIIVCLLPIALGIILYEKLPNDMPMHFSTANGVDNYANKNFVIFGLPILMAFVQTILMIVMKKANRETSTVIKI